MAQPDCSHDTACVTIHFRPLEVLDHRALKPSFNHVTGSTVQASK